MKKMTKLSNPENRHIERFRIKRHFAKKLLAAIMVFLITGLLGAVYALDLAEGASANPSPYTNDGASIIPELGFSGPVFNLSLAQAIDRAHQCSTALATAEANKTANEAKAEGYYAISNEEMGEFIDEQDDRNYKAEMNALDKTIVRKYFETVQARLAVQFSQENSSAQTAALNMADLKFKNGAISQNDLLKAQANASQATADLQTAQNGYTMALMSFNQFLGYPLMQNTILTDKLALSGQSLTPLSDAIARAKDNRNEVIAGEFMRDYLGDVKNDMEDLYDQSRSSLSKHLYLSAESAWMIANQAADDAPDLIEMDVRGKYMAAIATQSALDASQLGLEKANTAKEIANISLNQGLITAVDVQFALTGVYQANLMLLKGQLNNRLAILDYEQSMGLGTTSVTIPAPVIN
ncbi:MAG: TolC family protein [Eubacteriales bacterium]|nr:TolC family protein [Eubacteriales bacterium]